MDKVTISNLQGENGLANVVRYFLNNGSEYLIYSLNEVDDAGYTRLYVAKITGVDGMYNADTLSDTEWNDIKNLVKVIVKANKENLPVPVQDINPNKIRNLTLKDKKIFKLNTPLVNDLTANKPNFNGVNDNMTSVEQKDSYEVPSTPAFNTPVQPTFDIPSTPTYNTPVQPAFDIPNTPTYETPVQPTFDIPSTPTYETPVQPTFDIPSTPTYETPVQPTFDMPTTGANDTADKFTNLGSFNFGATNIFSEQQTQNNNNQQNEQSSIDLQEEITRLNEELTKYKTIVDNIKNLIEK